MGPVHLRRLTYFLVVAEEQTITRAASRLGMAQPPLSQQVRLLEKELGAPLLTRTARGVRLTAAGEVVAREGPRVLAHLARMRERVQAAAAGEGGHLVVGAAPVACTWVAPVLLRRFSEALPGVGTRVVEVDQATAYDQLRSGLIDLAVTRMGLDTTGLTIEELMRERALLAVPYDDPLLQRETVHLADLRDRDFVLFSRRLGRHHFDEFVGACRAIAGFSPRVVAEADTVGSQLVGIASRAGIGFVTELTAASPVPGVAFREIADLPMEIPLVLAWAEGDSSPARRRFVQDAHAWARERRAEG